jgi:ELWxxDGT repeat protein
MSAHGPAAGGYQLWVTDGTPGGTRQVATPEPNPGSSDPHDLSAVNGRLVFGATMWRYGDEPWVFVPDDAPAPRAGAVAARHVFYDNSYHDSFHPGGDAKDDPAIATDKRALLPGQTASFANVTSYNKGINGVMIDVAGLPAGATLSADDFIIRSGAAPSPAALLAGPSTNLSVTVRRGKGVNGSDRVTLTWPDGTIKNQWLQVTMKSTDDTGLATPDVFYFGNVVGETGDAGSPLRVGALDLASIRRNLSAAAQGVTSLYDINRDGKLNALDLAAVRAGYNRSLAPLAAPGPSAALSTATATSLLDET